MNKDLLKYFNYEKNAVKAEFVISREKLPNGYEYIVVSNEEIGEIYSGYQNPNKKKKDSKAQTGGKKPYVMLMINEFKNKSITYDVLGAAISLANNIQWNTGLLINKRSKKPLKADDIANILNCSRSKVFSLIKELKINNLMFKDDKGYRINNTFIKKGGVNK